MHELDLYERAADTITVAMNGVVVPAETLRQAVVDISTLSYKRVGELLDEAAVRHVEAEA